MLSWGDSRIGNMMYRDFAPVAVLDWEMAAVAPPEVDLAWMAFMHFFFESMLGKHGMSGLPDLLRPATWPPPTGSCPATSRATCPGT